MRGKKIVREIVTTLRAEFHVSKVRAFKRVFTYLRGGNLCDDGVLCECRASHEVEDLLAVLGRETGSAVRHQAFAL